MLVLITAFLIRARSSANPWPDYLPHHAAKNVVLTIVGAVVDFGLVAARGVWFVHGGLKKLGAGDAGAETALTTFLAPERSPPLPGYLVGAILGLLILTASAQRQAIQAYKPDH